MWLFSEKGTSEVVFIESKLRSKEGESIDVSGEKLPQLKKYADHLHYITVADRRTLLYVTRDYDFKEEDKIFRSSDDLVNFRQTRWSVFYHVLRDRTHDDSHSHFLHHETMRFMEAHGMDNSTRFTPANALSLNNIKRTYSFLRSTLNEGPAEQFKETLRLGEKPKPKLYDQDKCYVLIAKDKPKYPSLQVIVGFFFELPTSEYPELRLQIGTETKKRRETPISTVLRSLSGRVAADVNKADGWAINVYDDWLNAYIAVPMEALLNEKDHLAACQRTFIELLEELKAVKDAKHELPWSALKSPAKKESAS